MGSFLGPLGVQGHGAFHGFGVELPRIAVTGILIPAGRRCSPPGWGLRRLDLIAILILDGLHMGTTFGIKGNIVPRIARDEKGDKCRITAMHTMMMVSSARTDNVDIAVEPRNLGIFSCWVSCWGLGPCCFSSITS